MNIVNWMKLGGLSRSSRFTKFFEFGSGEERIEDDEDEQRDAGRIPVAPLGSGIPK